MLDMTLLKKHVLRNRRVLGKATRGDLVPSDLTRNYALLTPERECAKGSLRELEIVAG
jgi:hypothetical protein